MSDSPAVILYDPNGNEVTIRDGYEVTASQSGVPIIGVDSDGYARILQLDGTGAIATISAPKTKRFEVASTTVTYIGSAVVGSSEGDAVWSITKLVTTAEGDPVSAKVALNAVWDNRAAEVYL